MSRYGGTAALLALGALLAACDTADAPAARSAPPAAAVAADDGVVDLGGLGYETGDADAPVTVIEFSDFGCPYCARFALETFPVLHQEFVRSGRVRWRYVPFALGIFPNGQEAALAAECAGAQDRFWPMHDRLYENQREWKSSDEPARVFRELAARAGLDVQRFGACYDGRERAARVERSNQAALRVGVRATPSFLVNGRPVEGALPLEQFRSLLQWAESGGR